MPIYCGRERAGTGCVDLAVVAIDSRGRHTIACTAHRAELERWAAGGGAVTITPVTQPADAVGGHGQDALFELDNSETSR